MSYYDRDGQPITMVEWTTKTREYRRVALDERGDVRVSTVWLGLDHNFGGGPPLIFETMVFGGDRDETEWRWHTEAEALVGHAEICSAVFRD